MPSRDRIRVWALPAALLAGLVAVGCSSHSSHSDLVNGKTLFVQKCGACHTLARAATKGAVGPNLDAAFRRALADGEGRSTVKGIVYDRANVIAETQIEIERAGLTDRCQAVAGNFFESVPAGADCYALRLVIHDWDDGEAETILRHCRKGITAEGRLLIFEIVMPDSDDPHPAKGMDWVMLSCVTGQERTEAEYAKILERAGFRLTRVVPSPSPMSVVEAVPV